MSSRIWVERYRPKTVAEVLGNERAKSSFIEWLEIRTVKKAAILFGPAGVGKTALVHAAARDHRYHVIEMNASDARTKSAIMKIAFPSTSIHSLDKFFHGLRGNIILLDEVDGIYGREDWGGITAIAKILKETRIPVVMTANTLDVQKFQSILQNCRLIRFRRVRIPILVVLLTRICQSEKISAEREALEAIAIKCKGDVRSAINDLQMLSEREGMITSEDVEKLAFRNRALDEYETLQGMFTSDSPEKALGVLNSSLVNHERLILSIHDNLPLCCNDLEELAEAYDLLSKADVFYGRIRQENWRLLRYTLELLAHSATLSSGECRHIDFTYPPTKVVMLAWTRRQRKLLNEISSSIASRCHVSQRAARRNILPFLKIILEGESHMASKITSWLDVDKRDILSLGEMIY